MNILDLLNVLPRMMGVLMSDFSSSNTALNETQQRVLLLLSESDSATMTQVSRVMNMEKGSMTPVIDKLIASGYLERERNPQDRRQYLLELTEIGQASATRLHAEIEDHMKGKFSVFTPEQYLKVQEAFETIQWAMNIIDQGENE